MKKNIIGTWLSDEKEEEKFVFNTDGTCIRYSSVGNPIKYKYTFTNQLKDCDPSRSGVAEDSTYYLHLIDIKDKYTYCYEINSLTDKMLSLSPFDKGRGILFWKQTRNRVKH